MSKGLHLTKTKQGKILVFKVAIYSGVKIARKIGGSKAVINHCLINCVRYGIQKVPKWFLQYKRDKPKCSPASKRNLSSRIKNEMQLSFTIRIIRNTLHKNPNVLYKHSSRETPPQPFCVTHWFKFVLSLYWGIKRLVSTGMMWCFQIKKYLR